MTPETFDAATKLITTGGGIAVLVLAMWTLFRKQWMPTAYAEDRLADLRSQLGAQILQERQRADEWKAEAEELRRVILEQVVVVKKVVSTGASGLSSSREGR